jgi:hypothetical protein
MILTIQKGNNIDLLKAYPDNYFDSIVTDSPYGLGTEPDAIKLLQDWIDHGYHEIKGKGFMGKSWDAFVPQPALWKECFRVLKPGGYLLSFFGTRTYDWGTLAIRLAGFEIRDMICWHYGSGFPKSLDVSKKLDKMAGAERQIIGSKGLNKFNGTRADKNKGKLGLDNRTFAQADALTAPCTDEAKEWAGYGTALKPATEPICIARKPIEGTVAQNILKYGTGAINLDGCRIEFESDEDLASATFGTGTNIIGANYIGSKLTDGRKNIEADPKGRFPANVIFDDFTGKILDEQSGILASGGGRKGEKGKRNYLDNSKSNSLSGARSQSSEIYNDPIRGAYTLSKAHSDIGGASRFFYCAKASQEERNLGLSGFEPSTVTDGRNIPNDTPFQRGIIQRLNTHTTVKPISLM